MSKIGKKNIIIPKDSSIKIEGADLTITGPKGTKKFNINDKKHLTINSIGEVPKEAPSDIFSKSDETNQIDFDDNLID